MTDQKQMLLALLGGTDYREQVDLMEVGYPHTVTVRPLSDGEVTQVQSMLLAGMEGAPDILTGAMSIDVKDAGKFTEQMRRAVAMAVALALTHSGMAWTVDEVQSLPASVVTALASVVYRISGMMIPLAPGGGTAQPFRGGAGPSTGLSDAPSSAGGDTPAGNSA